ncbi:glutaredoxin [Nitzschia inconspicua]|uniref:Glutaredoxin n=1 Tax=Nitzschia inconspicua TaxID=303405 RepID=A0A9K3PRT2_9STRA|nr:glutaredoxin [Nitzschia inconspicua]
MKFSFFVNAASAMLLVKAAVAFAPQGVQSTGRSNRSFHNVDSFEHPIGNVRLQSSSSSSTDEKLAEFQEKASEFFENLGNSIQYRYGLFSSALKEYNFKQSMAITIAGDDYDSEQVQQEIRSIVDSNPCVMFIWESSPSCKKAIQAFDRMGDVTVKIVRLDDPWSEGNKMRAELGKMTGKPSVPSVWIGGEYVGGYDAGVSDQAPGLVTMAFQGTLRPKLQEAGALQ